MPNAVLAQSLEDELEGSLLGNALSPIPIPIISVYALLQQFFPPPPSFQVAFTIPSFNVSLDSLEVYLKMLYPLLFRLSVHLTPCFADGIIFLVPPTPNSATDCLGV